MRICCVIVSLIDVSRRSLVSFNHDKRAITGQLNFGTLECGLADYYETDTESHVHYTREYGGCFLVGYQRLTAFNMVFLIQLGTAHNWDGGNALCSSMGFGYRL